VALKASWLEVRTGQSVHRYDALALPVVGALMGLLVAAVIVSVAVEGVVLARSPLRVAPLLAALQAALTLALLTLEEVTGPVLSLNVVPVTLRRSLLEVRGGAGAWLGLVSALSIVVLGRLRGGWTTALATLTALPLRQRVGLPGMSAIVAVGAWARYQPWVDGAARGDSVRVPGWSLPWLGPATLMVVALLGACLAAQFVTSALLPILGTALSGWLLSFSAAVTIVFVSSVGRVDVRNWLPAAIRSFTPSVRPGWGAWVTFATGLGAVGWAAAGILNKSQTVAGPGPG
jgi:hypothetical protein